MINQLKSALTGSSGPASSPQLSMVAPGSAGTPSLANIGDALSSNPGTAGLDPSMVSGISQGASPLSMAAGGLTAAGVMTGNPALAGAGMVGEIFTNFLAARALKAQPDPTAYAPEHNSTGGVMTGQVLQPQQAQIQVPGQY